MCFTISANLSGTYNAAVMGRDMVLEEHPEKEICVIDSKATAGAMILLVRRAKQLMADPALRISEVAERVGYTDTAHFSRVFKKLEGVSAGEWRNLHCGKDL